MSAELESVVNATLRCSFRIWGYGIGPALTGLVRAGHGSYVRELVAPAAARPAGDPTDHLIPVEALVELGLDGPWAKAFRAAVVDAERPVPRQPRVHRPDFPPWQRTIWVDCLHTDGPGLVLLGDHEAAVQLTEEACAALQREDGLFDHGYDVAAGRGNGVAWGRGQGWALLGLTGVLAHVPDERLADRLRRLVAVLAECERDGRWGTVVDRPDASVELSTSAYVAYAVGTAVRHGLIDATYGDLADRAFAAALAGLENGVLPTSEATPVGPVESYLDRPLGLHPWGQGPLLLALLDGAGK